MTIDEVIENFSLLDEWDDRYRYVPARARPGPPVGEPPPRPPNRGRAGAPPFGGATTAKPNGADGPILTFVGDSDAHIVRGLIAILFALYSGKTAREILATDALQLFDRMGLREHLTPQRSNGLRSMVDRIRSDARACLAMA
jgi:cysteine desulfuration protein SufE